MMNSQSVASPSTDLLTELPDCVVVIDGFGRILWGNRAAERLFCRSLQESIGYQALDLVHPDDLELVLRSLETVRRKDVGTLIEVRARIPSGWCLLEVVGTSVAWPTEPAAVLLCMRDLTERRRFEVAHNKDAVIRAVVQNSPDIMILLSKSGLVESVSGALSRILGHDPEAAEGRRIVDLVFEEDRTSFLSSLRAAMRGATASHPVRTRIRLTRHDGGSPVPFEFAFVNLLEDPTVASFVVSAHDITEQVAAETERYQSEQRFRQIFAQGPLGVILTDLEHRITDVNAVFCQLVGLPSDKVVDSAFLSFVHRNDRERARAFEFELADKPMESHKVKIEFESSNEKVLHASVTATAIKNEDGEPIHYLRIIEDITKRTLLERELVAHAHTASQLLASLTSREAEILELVSEENATASAIAHRLTLSVRTVESHLAHAYRKLGVNSRAGAKEEFERLKRTIAGVPYGDGSP